MDEPTRAEMHRRAEAGDADAQYQLGCFYEENGDDAELDLAVRLFRSAAEQGHAAACYSLHWFVDDPQERDRWLLRAGELGCTDAERDLGALCATGDWTGLKDEAAAVKWYRRAAEKGHDDAQYNLGFMHLLGDGAPHDPQQGAEWLRRAAEQGHADAIRLLADCYRNGRHGLAPDAQQAAYWEAKQKEGGR